MFSNQKQSMDGGPMRHAGVRSPIVVDPIYNGGKYSNRSARPVPRVKAEASGIAEKSKGCMDVLFANYGKPDPAMVMNTIEGDIDPRGEGPMKKAGIWAPILADPIYKDRYTGRTPRPAARVRPEAEEVANKNRGIVGRLMEDPVVRYNHRPQTVAHPGVRSSVFPQQKSPSKNHTSANYKRIRQIARQSRNNSGEEPKVTPVKALWKSPNYEKVESRVKPFMQSQPQAPRPSSVSSSVSTNSRSPTPTRKPINFVARNARSAKTHELRRSRSSQALHDSQVNYKKKVRGKTPIYLQTRQREWEADEIERLRNEPDPTIPEGHVVLPDQERRETLNNLKKSQQELLEQHRLLPIRSKDSIGVRNRKSELEKRISEVDEAIEVFNRPRVFVRLDQ